ncbi:MAG TPA: hypothetical protein VFK61_08760 [Candidatus Limnocylindria bacterium]|nr:hypothetical protein [Candidatus Limnocylindria bacterium]
MTIEATRVSWRQVAVPLFIAAFLGVQLLVPVVQLFGPRPQRFGWQMYSALPEVPRVFAIQADGVEREVDLARLFAVQRSEINYVAALQAGACDATGAAAIRLAFENGESQAFPCR